MTNNNKKKFSITDFVTKNLNVIIIGSLIIALLYFARQPRDKVYRLGQLGGNIPSFN